MNGIKIACPQGDPRLMYASRVLISGGFEVVFPKSPVTIPHCDVLLLPIPTKRFIDENPEYLRILLTHLKKDGRIFSSSSDYIAKSGIHPADKLYDYTADTDFISINTTATCEGALSIAISNTPKTIRCSRVLVTGWGKLAKCLFHMLKSLNAEVMVAARNPTALSEVHSLGSEGVYFGEIYNLIDSSDIIINTVPCRVIDRDKIRGGVSGKLFIELASAPFGFDADELSALGAKCILAPSLPSKYAPESSGYALGRAVCRLCSEGIEI